VTGRACDLDWGATIRSVAHLQAGRRRPGGPRVALRARDLQRKLRRLHPARLLLFLVDVSGSMGRARMDLAMKAAHRMLEGAYARRDRVAVVAFRGREAALLVPPTGRAETVSRTLSGLACGGLTPLGAGLAQALKILERARAADPALRSTLVLMSDGRANVGSRPGHRRMISEIEALGASLAALPRLGIVFLDATEQGKQDHPARWLARVLNARRVPLRDLHAAGREPAEEIRRVVM